MAKPKTKLSGPVRVRFPPSPTGHLHVGGARTAIYNDLLRYSLGGAFVLRIEDTDKKRSDPEMTRQITESLAWLGVPWDEGPLLQSERVERHREAAFELVEQGQAYRCFCTPEHLEELRRAAEAKKETFRYPRTCLALAPEEAERRAAAGEPFVVRFKMPDGHVHFSDLVRGELDFPPDALDDFILLRSDGSPTYHLSVCVDDSDMAISHILRGDDHLSNTPKHVPLFAALGATRPLFGHMPLILGPDKKRLSKRTGATSVEEFRAQGILPQALYNYLALLGWSPGGDRELMSRDEMIELFTVERLQPAAAVFDPDKLAWMNSQYMSSLPLEEILRNLQPFLEPAGIADPEPRRLATAADLHRQRAKTLVELAQVLIPYFAERLTYEPERCGKYLDDPELPRQLAELARRYQALERFEIEPLETALRQLAEEEGVKAGVLIHPTRMALSGEKAGPPLFDLVAAMGREATGRHMGNFLAFLERGGEA